MNYRTKAAVIITALVALLAFGWAQRAGGQDPITKEPEPIATTTEEVSRETEQKPVPRVTTYEESEARRVLAESAYLKVQAEGTEDREEWLLALEWCESRSRWWAVNQEDLDGTPSYGLLQFKPGTFAGFSKAYGIPGELMDPEAQRAIVRRMMDDESIRWEKQFPWCVTRYIGWPPGVLE